MRRERHQTALTKLPEYAVDVNSAEAEGVGKSVLVEWAVEEERFPWASNPLRCEKRFEQSQGRRTSTSWSGPMAPSKGISVGSALARI
jgi:hypothetical protein